MFVVYRTIEKYKTFRVLLGHAQYVIVKHGFFAPWVVLQMKREFLEVIEVCFALSAIISQWCRYFQPMLLVNHTFLGRIQHFSDLYNPLSCCGHRICAKLSAEFIPITHVILFIQSVFHTLISLRFIY